MACGESSGGAAANARIGQQAREKEEARMTAMNASRTATQEAGNRAAAQAEAGGAGGSGPSSGTTGFDNSGRY
jgi:hypothetical protein